VHTAERLVPKIISFEFQIGTEKLSRNKSPCTDQSPAKLVQTGGNLCIMFWDSQTCYFYLEWRWIARALEVLIKLVMKLIIVILKEYHSYYLYYWNFIQYSFLNVNFIRRRNYCW